MTFTFGELWDLLQDRERGTFHVTRIDRAPKHQNLLSWTLDDDENDGEKTCELHFGSDVTGSTLMFYPASKEVMVKTASKGKSKYGYHRYSFDDDAQHSFFPIWDLHYPEEDKKLVSAVCDLYDGLMDAIAYSS